MSKVPFLDFIAIKRNYSVEELMERTGLSFKRTKTGEYRCECPVHKGGDRALVVNLYAKDEKGDEGVFFCHAAQVGGDRVSLLAHVRDSKPYAVFKELHDARPLAEPSSATVPEEKLPPRETEGEGGRGFRPLPYLQAEHDAVQAMGFQPETAQALGIGFSPRGFHRGRVALPMRTADGTLIGYISIEANTSVQLPPKWNL